MLSQALVHSSFANENPGAVAGHNERLEFLGDAVLGVIVSDMLFRQLPNHDEGDLTARRAALVNRAALAEIARDIGLHQSVRLGRGESEAGGADRTSVLAGTFEAVVGALYLSDGLAETVRVLSPVLEQRARKLTEGAETPKSAKTRLQEWSQQQRRGKPAYELRSIEGPAHQQQFTIEAVVGGRPIAAGTGSSRQRAEEAAAEAALAALSTAR